MDIVKDKQEGDMFIVNTDNELTDTIKKTFEGHGCQVTVSQLEKDLIALYILLNKKISIKKLKKLIEKGNKFGLEFFLTKTGMTTSLLSKVHQIFKWWKYKLHQNLSIHKFRNVTLYVMLFCILQHLRFLKSVRKL